MEIESNPMIVNITAETYGSIHDSFIIRFQFIQQSCRPSSKICRIIINGLTQDFKNRIGPTSSISSLENWSSDRFVCS